MRVLVTGGAGFIGSHVVDRLIYEGHEVVVLDNLSGGFNRNTEAFAEVNLDICDYPALAQVFATFKPEWVFHFAAYAAEGLSSHIKRHNYNVNLMGSMNLINLSVLHNVKCFVFASSAAIYGAKGQPEDSYAIAKRAVELELENSARRHGLDFITFRLHNVYGPRQSMGDRYRNVVAIFIRQILSGEEVTVFGDGSQTRQFTYIHDIDYIISQAPLTVMRNTIYDLGAVTSYSILRLAYDLHAAANETVRIKYLPARDEVQHCFSEHTALPLPRMTPFEKGLAHTMDWATAEIEKETPALKSPEIEVEKGLPDAWK